MKLTIAIPTYNRNDIFRANLEKLLPQVTNECRVIIFDNCSDIPIENTVKDLLSKYLLIIPWDFILPIAGITPITLLSYFSI